MSEPLDPERCQWCGLFHPPDDRTTFCIEAEDDYYAEKKWDEQAEEWALVNYREEE